MKYRRVLIASAEANVRRAVRRAVEESSHSILTDEIGEDVGAAVQSGSKRYDVIVLDLDGPGGLQHLKAIVSHNLETAVVVLASRPRLEDALQAVRLGVSDVLEKPATPLELTEAIDTALQRRRNPLRRILAPRRAAPVPTNASGSRDRLAEAHPESAAGDPPSANGPTVTIDAAYSYLECLQQARNALSKHDEASARRWIRTGLSIDTERPEAYNLLGVVSEMEQDVGQAMRYYRAAVALDPMYEPPRNNLHRITGLRDHAKRDLGVVESELNEKQK